MSKKRKRRRPDWSNRYPEIKPRKVQRDSSHISNILSDVLNEIQKKGRLDDNRRFRPPISPLSLKSDGRPVSYRSDFNRTSLNAWNHNRKQEFLDSVRVEECISRRRRRRELFKRGKVGKGKRVSSVRRMTERSKIKC